MIAAIKIPQGLVDESCCHRSAAEISKQAGDTLASVGGSLGGSTKHVLSRWDAGITEETVIDAI